MDSDFYSLAKAMFIEDEGYRHFPYLDTKGNLTIGIGHNLDAEGLSNPIIDRIFVEDLARTIKGCYRAFPDIATYSLPRQLALVNMAFQMGLQGLLGFRKTIALIREGRWEDAAIEAAESKWAKVDSPKRAARVIKMLRDG